MYSLKVPLRVLVQSTSRVGRSAGSTCRFSFYFYREKVVSISVLVSISSVSNSLCLYYFLNKMSLFASIYSIQQSETEMESNGIKLVAACIKEGMWLEATLRRCCRSRPLRTLTTECTFEGNGSSLRSRLEVLGWEHRQNPLQDKIKEKLTHTQKYTNTFIHRSR
jgi:hypothetical protein